MITVEKFVTYEEAEQCPESPIGGMGGWIQKGMRWQDYLTQFPADFAQQLEALRAAIIKQGIRCNGARHQHDEDYESAPVFSDGTAATYSYRAWGDLMAAVWATEDDTDYSYMDFYC